MDLLERYLAAVARDLPEKQRADVVAELRDSLLSMIEDAEARLGRPQTKAELEAMLIAFGHPLRVAGRYRKTQHLIGPAIFPFWWAWLRAALVIVATIYFVLVGVQAFSEGNVSHILHGIDASLTNMLLTTFGVVTLVAAALERWGKPQWKVRWTPRDLPPAKGKPPSQFERVLELAMSLVFLGWWTGAIQFRNWLGNHVQLELAPVWADWFWPILAYSVFECAANLLALARPGGVQLNRLLSIVRHLAAAGILGGVLQAGHFVEAVGTTTRFQATIDTAFGAIIGVTIFGFMVKAAVEIWRLVRYDRFSAASMAASPSR